MECTLGICAYRPHYGDLILICFWSWTHTIMLVDCGESVIPCAASWKGQAINARTHYQTATRKRSSSDGGNESLPPPANGSWLPNEASPRSPLSESDGEPPAVNYMETSPEIDLTDDNSTSDRGVWLFLWNCWSTLYYCLPKELCILGVLDL